MKGKTFIILLLYFIIIFFSGFNSLEPKSNILKKLTDTCKQSHFQDSLKLLEEWKIDYGFNKGITLLGDSTYNLYKNKVRWMPGVAMQVLELKSGNSFVFIKFTNNHEIEKIQYNLLKEKNNKDKIFYAKNNYHTDYFGFKVGDSLSFVLKKLKDVEYKIEKNLSSKKNVCVNIHGLLKFNGIKNTIYDEYICSYCFVNEKLNLIEINYFRDVPGYRFNPAIRKITIGG